VAVEMGLVAQAAVGSEAAVEMGLVAQAAAGSEAAAGSDWAAQAAAGWGLEVAEAGWGWAASEVAVRVRAGRAEGWAARAAMAAKAVSAAEEGGCGLCHTMSWCWSSPEC